MKVEPVRWAATRLNEKFSDVGSLWVGCFGPVRAALVRAQHVFIFHEVGRNPTAVFHDIREARVDGNIWQRTSFFDPPVTATSAGELDLDVVPAPQVRYAVSNDQMSKFKSSRLRKIKDFDDGVSIVETDEIIEDIPRFEVEDIVNSKNAMIMATIKFQQGCKRREMLDIINKFYKGHANVRCVLHGFAARVKFLGSQAEIDAAVENLSKVLQVAALIPDRQKRVKQSKKRNNDDQDDDIAIIADGEMSVKAKQVDGELLVLETAKAMAITPQITQALKDHFGMQLVKFGNLSALMKLNEHSATDRGKKLMKLLRDLKSDGSERSENGSGAGVSLCGGQYQVRIWRKKTQSATSTDEHNSPQSF